MYHAHPPYTPAQAHTQNVVRCGVVQSPPGASLADARLSPPGGGCWAGGPSPVPEWHTLAALYKSPLGAPTYLNRTETAKVTRVSGLNLPKCLKAAKVLSHQKWG
eukprot:1113624-Prymnesium_polylepis.1